MEKSIRLMEIDPWSLARNKELLNKNLSELANIKELINQNGSDSMSLDNLLELLNLGGIDLKTSVKMLMPPAYQKKITHKDKNTCLSITRILWKHGTDQLQ